MSEHRQNAPAAQEAPAQDQLAADQAQQAVNQAVSTLFPAFDFYVRRQTELNEAQVKAINDNQKHQERCTVDSFGKKIRVWATEESQHVTTCDGGSVKAVRTWIRSVKAAQKRAPSDSKDHCVKLLILKTSRGELFEEIDDFMNKNDRDLVDPDTILSHVLEAFLGPDEQDALRDELKKVRQAPREDIPAYNRRFTKTAADAYPLPTTEEKKRITTMYLVGLKKGRLQDKLFDRDPRLSNLEDATAAAYDEWARARYRERAMHEMTREHEPMEVDGMVTVREAVSKHDRAIEKYEQELRALKQQLAASKISSPAPAVPAFTPSTSTPASGKGNLYKGKPVNRDQCRFCGEQGHWVKDCEKNKEFWKRKGGERRSLPKHERALNSNRV